MQQIKIIRKRLGVTQSELAKFLGFKNAFTSMLENGFEYSKVREVKIKSSEFLEGTIIEKIKEKERELEELRDILMECRQIRDNAIFNE